MLHQRSQQPLVQSLLKLLVQDLDSGLGLVRGCRWPRRWRRRRWRTSECRRRRWRRWGTRRSLPQRKRRSLGKTTGTLTIAFPRPHDGFLRGHHCLLQRNCNRLMAEVPGVCWAQSPVPMPSKIRSGHGGAGPQRAKPSDGGLVDMMLGACWAQSLFPVGPLARTAWLPASKRREPASWPLPLY